MPPDTDRRYAANSKLTPAERSERSRAAVNARWAKHTTNRGANTARLLAAAEALGITEELQAAMAELNTRDAEQARKNLAASRAARNATQEDAI